MHIQAIQMGVGRLEARREKVGYVEFYYKLPDRHINASNIAQSKHMLSDWCFSGWGCKKCIPYSAPSGGSTALHYTGCDLKWR